MKISNVDSYVTNFVYKNIQKKILQGVKMFTNLINLYKVYKTLQEQR